METIAPNRLARIAAHPKYHDLTHKRGRLGWALTSVMLLAYFGFVLLIAFDKELLAQPISDGVTSIGIPMGFGVIVLGVLLTAIYVRVANREFDRLLDELLAEVAE